MWDSRRVDLGHFLRIPFLGSYPERENSGAALDARPLSEKAGGLNGSMQHLLKVFLEKSRRLISFAGMNSNKTKALFRF